MNDRTHPKPPRVALTLMVMAAVIAAVLLLDDRRGRSPDPVAAPEPPRAVSAEEFCTAFSEVNFAYGANLTEPSAEAIQKLKDAAAALAELVDGVEMSDRGKAGVRFVTSTLLRLEYSAVGEVDTFGDQTTLQDTANAKALGEYVGDNCVARPQSEPK